MSNILHDMARAMRAAVAPLAAACAFSACSGELSETLPGEGEYYDGPLAVRARIDGQVGTRSTYPEGSVTGGSWYLFCPLSSNQSVLSFLDATFENGFATLKDTTGNSVELKWTGLHPVFFNSYLFVMDNVPHRDFSERHFYSEYIEGENNNVYIGRGVKFTEEEVEKYRASLETEDGENNSNDIIQGYTSFASTDVGKKAYIEIPLIHLMSRLGVEVTSTFINLAEEPAKVWIDHIAAESYALNRLRAGDYEQNTLVIHPLNGSGDVIYAPDSTDEVFYNHTFYLLGGPDKDSTLIPVEGREGTYRTRRLILPPQSTHPDGALRPRVYIEVGGKRYSSLIPVDIVVGGVPVVFGEFKSNQDVTLSAEISDKPPYIKFSARVQKWNDKGTHVLETKEGGVYDGQDFAEAVKLFDEYLEKASGSADDSLRLRHALERYGHWSAGTFVFDFYAPLCPDENDLPDSLKINKEGKDDAAAFFNVDLHAHKVYGCNGTEEKGGSELKSKMLGRETTGVGTEEDLKKAWKTFCEYVQYMKHSSGETAERNKYRALLEQYGWWKVTEPLWCLHIRITADIVGEFPTDLESLNGLADSAGKYLEFEMEGHKVWGISDAQELKDKLLGKSQ